MSQNKEIPLSRCHSSAAVNLRQKEKERTSMILNFSYAKRTEWDEPSKYALNSNTVRIARVHFLAVAHQHHQHQHQQPVKGLDCLTIGAPPVCPDNGAPARWPALPGAHPPNHLLLHPLA